jgi:DNA-binding transcriptional LysR family regulator
MFLFAQHVCKFAPMPDWDDLKFFITAVRAGNYTHAANRLKVNRTTVGRRINALESDLGISLFEQTPTGYRPTTAGRAVLESAEQIEREIEKLTERLAAPDQRVVSTVRVAVSGEIGTEFMAELLAFRKSEPDIKLELLTARDALTTVLQRKADLGICLVPYRPENTRGIRIGQLSQKLYASQGYLDALPSNHRFEDHDWIGWGKEAANSASARWLKTNLHDSAKISAEVNSWDAFKQAVQSGLGIGHMWSFVADREPSLVSIRDIEPELSMELWLLVRDDVPPDTRTKKLMEFLGAAMKRRIGN